MMNTKKQTLDQHIIELVIVFSNLVTKTLKTTGRMESLHVLLFYTFSIENQKISKHTSFIRPFSNSPQAVGCLHSRSSFIDIL